MMKQEAVLPERQQFGLSRPWVFGRIRSAQCQSTDVGEDSATNDRYLIGDLAESYPLLLHGK